jgi:hypothetical protein
MLTSILTRAELAAILGVRPERLSSLGADAGLDRPTDKRSYSTDDLGLLVRHLQIQGAKVPMILEPFRQRTRPGDN